MSNTYRSAGHCKYLVQYHIIWCPKFRFPVLSGDVETVTKQILYDICETYKYELKTIEVTPDHIHVFVSVPHTVAPNDVARTLKSLSAIKLFRMFPCLKKFYQGCGALWNRGCFLSTDGHISADEIIKYIEEQRSN